MPTRSRFTLKPDQTIREHDAPTSPFFVVVLKGRGVLRVETASKRPVAPIRCLCSMRAKTVQSAPSRSWSLLASCTERRELKNNVALPATHRS